MKSMRKAVLVAVCLMAAGAANAQLGGLGNMLSGKKAATSATGDVGTDVDGFLKKSSALGVLASSALSAINSAFASDAEIAERNDRIAAISKISDVKERDAQVKEMYESEAAKAKTLLESGQMEKEIDGLSAKKKKLIGDGLLNFGIGGLQALDLAKQGQAVLQSTASNPMMIAKVAPVKGALPLLGKVASDSGGFIVGIAKLARGANIKVQTPKADTKPAALDMGDFGGM